MVGVGGPVAAGDDAMKMLWDYDEINHKYHIVRKNMTVAQAKEYRKQIKKRNANKMFIPVSQQIVFRTKGRGKGKRVIAMRKKMNWRGRAGGKYHSYKNKEVARWFGSHPIVPKGEFKGS
jgi:hypothetical protein